MKLNQILNEKKNTETTYVMHGVGLKGVGESNGSTVEYTLTDDKKHIKTFKVVGGRSEGGFELTKDQIKAADAYYRKDNIPELEKVVKAASPFGKLESRHTLTEDWGSSDWHPIIKAIDDAIEKHGLKPDVIHGVAQQEADFYHDSMGYEDPEDAVDAIIGAWKRMSEKGRQLAKLFGE